MILDGVPSLELLGRVGKAQHHFAVLDIALVDTDLLILQIADDRGRIVRLQVRVIRAAIWIAGSSPNTFGSANSVLSSSTTTIEDVFPTGVFEHGSSAFQRALGHQ